MLVSNIQHSASTVTHIFKSSPPPVRSLSINTVRCYRIINCIFPCYTTVSVTHLHCDFVLLCPLIPFPVPHYTTLPNPSPLETTSPFSVFISLLFCSILLCFYSPQISEIIWYLSFSTWLISLSIIPSRSIHVVANGTILFLWWNNILLCVCT